MINNAWNKLSGWKTFTGGLLHAIWFGVYVYGNITKQYEIEDSIQWRGHIIIGVWTGVGIIDKIKKRQNGKTN